MRNVAGLSTSEAQKSSDMFGKCRYLDEITGGRGVVFATGTPVSNSMTELYTVMRYLQYSTLQQKKLTHFDCWASTFGETTTAIELAPEGTGYRARTRFAKFFNLPELMSMFKEVADIKTSDQLHLPVPEAKFETVVAKPSEIQKEMVQELSKRAADIHSGIVDASVDNMLCVTNDGRKIGLDVRLMNPMLPDDPNSKLNVCVQNVLKIWEDGKDQKLTQLLFCDLSTPKNDGNFNVYEDIRKKLIAVGVPENEIEFIRKYNGKLLIKPSKQSVGSLLKKVREIVKSNKSAKQDSLIRQLNPVIRGWVNNQRFVVSAETFSKIDYQIYNCLWQWAKRRHKNKGIRWIAAKYWHRIGTRNWTFAAEERTKKNGEQSYFALEYATDTKIIRFKKIVSNANPFDERWNGYYEERDGEKMLNSTNGREKLLKVWRNQRRCCPVCNEPITSETSFKVHKVFRSGKSPWLEMVHPECHAVLHKNDSCFVEPGSLMGAL